MKHILVIADPVDQEQTAFDEALRLAKVSVADIHVVMFCYEPIKHLKEGDEAFHTDVKKLLIDHHRDYLKTLIDAQEYEVDITYDVIWAKYIHPWIVEHTGNTPYDLIVKTGHRSESLFHTPTDWQLFRESPVPVYCVAAKKEAAKTSTKKKDKVVLVALDMMTGSQEKQDLNHRLIEAAFQLSVQKNAQLHCCHAIEIPTLVKDMDLIDVTAHIHKVENEVKEKTKMWFDIYGMEKNNLHIRQGTPWQVINNFARKLKADCVVIGSMGRKGIQGKVIGNTAEKFIHSAETDLLVI